MNTQPVHTMTERKFSVLFFILLTYLVLYPYAQHRGLPYLAFRIFGAIVTILSVYAVSFRRRFVLFALVLAVPAILQRTVLPLASTGALPIISVLLGLTFDIFIVIVIFRRVFMRDEPTEEAIFGALCIYLLVGFSFANLFAMLATLQPHAFFLTPQLNSHLIPDRFDLIYYSFSTLTCIGASGITPVTDQARSLSVIESLLGVLYLAVLISRLLAAYHARDQNSPTQPEKDQKVY